MPKPSKPADSMPTSFEAALAELDQLIVQLERGDLPLAQSLSAYQRGAALLRYAQSELAAVEQQVLALEGEQLGPLAPKAEGT